MAPRLLLLAPVLLLSLVACGQSEEVTPTPTPGETTATPTEASPTPTPDVETATPPPDATPLPAAPADWMTYSDPDDRFTIRYPTEWSFRDDSSLDRPAGELTAVMASFPLDGSLKEFPADGLKVDFYVDPPRAGADCREPPEQATPAELGELSGWQRFQPLDEPGAARA